MRWRHGCALSWVRGSRMPSVLVVDDEPSLRRMSKLVLSLAGYSVQTATNGLEALEIMEVEKPLAGC